MINSLLSASMLRNAKLKALWMEISVWGKRKLQLCCWCFWVLNSWVMVWPLPTDFPFGFEIVTGALPAFQLVCVFVVWVALLAALSPLASWEGYHFHSSTSDSEVSTAAWTMQILPQLTSLWQLYIEICQPYTFVQVSLYILWPINTKE